ncbi:MAG: outer membrane protein assembly factor BamA [Elusimicrobia bacterium]|nr:outer membrane protein assembly factor BamA [Elusimicrobiota bacterium]
MFKKIGFFVIVSIFLLSAYSVAPAYAREPGVISQVNVEGIQNASQSKVLGAIESRRGRTHTDAIARQDVRAILELGSFNDVQVRFDNATGVLTFTVSENPFVERITFTGNRQISNGRLRSVSVLRERDFFDLMRLEETRARITNLYRDQGFADVNIQIHPITNPETNRMTITFLITENNQMTIGGVTVEGAEAFSASRIERMMRTRARRTFREETFRRDLATIEVFYRNRGYIDFQVENYDIVFNEDRTQMFITVQISEGPRYTVGEIIFSGNRNITERELNRAINLRTGHVFNQARLIETLQAVHELYSDRGFLNVMLDPQFFTDGEPGVVDIEIVITENAVVYVGNIFIDGLGNTRERTIRREVLLNEGDVLSVGRVRRSIEHIFNLGFIEGAEPHLLPTQRPNVMDLAFEISEGKPGMITAGAGYSSIDQFVGSVQLQHMNLFGLAQRGNLLWEFGARRQNYQIDWTDPWFLNRRMSLMLSAYDMTRIREYASRDPLIGRISEAYRENRRGFSARISPRVSDRVSLLFGYSYEHVRLYDIDPRIVDELIYQDFMDFTRDRTSSFIFQIAYDTRDFIFSPTRGQRQLLSSQIAGGPLGGNVNFVKTQFRSTWFFPTFWRFILSANLHLGHVAAYGGQQHVPIYERFHVGGADTIRGYDFRTQIGPPGGGHFMAVANIEYQFPILQQRGRPFLMGAFFYDIGGTWDSWDDLQSNFHLGRERNNLKSGVGFGIRIATPVFPLRLDWGYGLNHRPGDRLQQFYFTIGNVF